MAHLCFAEIWIWASPFLPSCLSAGLRMKPNSRWLIWSKYNLLVSSDGSLCTPSPLRHRKDLGDVWRHRVSDSHCYYAIFIWHSMPSLWIFTVIAFWLLDRPLSCWRCTLTQHFQYLPRWVSNPRRWGKRRRDGRQMEQSLLLFLC